MMPFMPKGCLVSHPVDSISDGHQHMRDDTLPFDLAFDSREGHIFAGYCSCSISFMWVAAWPSSRTEFAGTFSLKARFPMICRFQDANPIYMLLYPPMLLPNHKKSVDIASEAITAI